MVVVICAVVLGTAGAASAGRKRVVVLDFEGPKGDKFHDDLVRLIKKSHTVVPTEKWNGAAEQLAAGAVSDRNIKKVARKLKVDAVVEGKIEKRRDEFIIRIKLHEGRSGELIGDTIDTKAEGPRIDGRAQRDLKDELVGAIDSVESNHLSGGDDEDEAPGKKGKKPAVAEADDDDRPVGKKARKPAAAEVDDDDRPVRGKFSRRSDDERGSDKVDRRGKKPAAVADDDEPVAKKPRKPADDRPAGKKPTRKTADDDEPAGKKPDDTAEVATRPVRKSGSAEDEPKTATSSQTGDGDDDARPARPRKVADADDDAGSAEADTAPPLDARTALSPGERALDAVFGLSLTMRRMSFAISPALQAKPPGYAGTPVAGAVLDATFYPLAFGHKRTGQLKNLGLELLYDRVLKLNSKDPMSNAVYSTIEQRFGLAAVFRHAFGKTAASPVVLGSLGYTRQSFNILGTVDIPDVKYSIIAPGVGLRLPLSGKLMLGADLKLLLVTSAGQIQDPDKYGASSVLGFEGSGGVDYQITPSIFARAALRFETIGFTFKGTGFQTNQRDGNPMTQDVGGARDNYFGGMATVGYLY